MNAKFRALLGMRFNIPCPKKPLIRIPVKWQRRINRVFASASLLALSLFAIWRVHLGLQINHQFDAIRKAGLPASPQELNRWYSNVPDTENAALVLTQA